MFHLICIFISFAHNVYNTKSTQYCDLSLCDLFLFLESRINSAVVRALAFHLCGPDSISWPAVKIDFVGSLLWSESFFLGTPVFPSHRKPTFGLICCDSICFVVSSSSKATVLGKIHWDLNKVIIIIIVVIIIIIISTIKWAMIIAVMNAI